MPKNLVHKLLIKDKNMKTLGWILFIFSICLVLVGGFMGKQVYTPGAMYSVGSFTRVIDFPLLIIGSVMLISSVMILMTSQLLDAIESLKSNAN